MASWCYDALAQCRTIFWGLETNSSSNTYYFHVMKRLEILRNKRKSKENQKEQNLLFTR